MGWLCIFLDFQNRKKESNSIIVLTKKSFNSSRNLSFPGRSDSNHPRHNIHLWTFIEKKTIRMSDRTVVPAQRQQHRIHHRSWWTPLWLCRMLCKWNSQTAKILSWKSIIHFMLNVYHLTQRRNTKLARPGETTIKLFLYYVTRNGHEYPTVADLGFLRHAISDITLLSKNSKKYKIIWMKTKSNKKSNWVQFMMK